MHGWLSSSSVGRLVKVDGARVVLASMRRFPKHVCLWMRGAGSGWGDKFQASAFYTRLTDYSKCGPPTGQVWWSPLMCPAFIAVSSD
jgi:hypothetical protein